MPSIRPSARGIRENEAPLVSIFCATYNHEKYIEDAIEGFVQQETNFPFEIVIHDDASTDATPEIIDLYAGRYPHLIRPIYQKDNQYRKGIKPSTIAIPQCRGRFIAMCEGDDYWCDSGKLQTQIDQMTNHPECDLSFHAAISYNEVTGESTTICQYKESVGKFSAQKAIMGDGSFMPTASLIFKKEIYYRLPKCFAEAPIGDWVFQIYGSLRGGALFLPMCSAVYRTNTPASHSARNKAPGVRIEKFRKIMRLADCLANDLGKDYAVPLNKITARKAYSLAKWLFLRGRVWLSAVHIGYGMTYGLRSLLDQYRLNEPES